MIIRAKIKEPVVSGDVILRKRIMNQIDATKHIMIIAPSGYGKTNLLTQIETDKCCVWYTLDEFDNHIYIFFKYLIYGLEEQVQGIKDYFNDYIEEIPRPIDSYDIANKLIDYLASRPEEIVIKLDGYSWINDVEINNFIKLLGGYSPSNLRLIIAIRRVPVQIPWIQTMRKFHVIKAQDLIFDEDEQIEYLGSELCAQNQIKGYLEKQANCVPFSMRLIKNVYFHHIEGDMNLLFETFIESVDKLTREILIVAGHLPYIMAEGINYIFKIDRAEEILDALIEKGYFIYKIYQHYTYNDLFRCDTLLIEKISH